MKKLNLLSAITLASTLMLQLGTLCFRSRGAPGDVDLSFDPGSGVNGPVNAVVVQPDGKVIIGGQFTTVGGLVRTNLARLNADGSGDSSFDARSLIPPGYYNTQVYSVALQPDGKVLVGQDLGITRLNSDGSQDTNFNAGASGGVSWIALQPDGKVILGGTTRLNSDGTLDTNFVSAASGYVYSMALQPDGKLIVGGYFYDVVNNTEGYGLLRLNANGSLDNSFDAGAAADGIYYSIVVQPDGKVLFGGLLTRVNGTNYTPIARLNANGSVDATFGLVSGTAAEGTQTAVNAIALQPDGKVIIGGQFVSINGHSRTNLARLSADGSLDLSFQNGVGGVSGQPQSYLDTSVRAIALQTNGTMHIGGAFTTVNGTYRSRVARLDADGSLDSSFNPGRGVDRPLSSLVVQPDGKVLIAGAGYTTRVGIGRLNANGSADDAFNPGTGANSDVVSIAFQPDGKILIGGSFTAVNGTNRLGLARLHADGGLDSSFNPCVPCLAPYDGIPQPYGGEYSTAVTTVLLQADGKILAAGYNLTFVTGEDVFGISMRYFVVRFLANGNADPAFTPFIGDATEWGNWYYGWILYPVSALTVQADGKIILSGQFYSVDDTNQTGIARLNANGTRDDSFAPAIGRNASVDSLRLQPDGKLLAAGYFGSVNGTNRTGILRLQANGTMDDTFNAITGPNPWVSTFALQPDGKVIIGGSFTNISGTNQNSIARLNSDGSLDGSFNPGTGANGAGVSVALQPNGNVLIGGNFTTINGVVRPFVARLYGDSAPSLNITWSDTFVLVSWPTTGLNFQLQENTNFSFPNSWSPVAEPALTNAGKISVTVPSTNGRKFFRLKSQ